MKKMKKMFDEWKPKGKKIKPPKKKKKEKKEDDVQVEDDIQLNDDNPRKINKKCKECAKTCKEPEINIIIRCAFEPKRRKNEVDDR